MDGEEEDESHRGNNAWVRARGWIDHWTMPKKDPAVVVGAAAVLGAAVPGGLPPPAPAFGLTAFG